MLECTDRTIIICAQNYNLKSATLLGAGVPPWNNECSRPLKNECSSSPPKIIGARRALKIMSAHAPKIMGARPHFSREYFMSLFFEIPFIFKCSFISSLIECSLNDECSRPLKNRCSSSPPKIIGARRAPENNGCARTHFFREAFHELISFMSTLQLLTCSLLICLWTMSACAPLNGECSCPPRKLVLVEHS